MKKYLFLFLIFLATPAFAGFESVIQYYNAAGGEGITYDTGNLMSERFGTTGSDGSDLTWEKTVEGTGVWNDDDQTYAGGTGFVADHLTVSYASGQANAVHDLGSAQTTLYFRGYIRCNSESWADGANETIVGFVSDGDTIGDNTYALLKIQQVATSQFQLGVSFASGVSIETGSASSNITCDGTVYKVELKIIDNGASDEFEWWVDGVSIGSHTADLAAWDSTGVKDIYVGLSYHTAAINVSIDTIDIDSTGRLVDE